LITRNRVVLDLRGAALYEATLGGADLGKASPSHADLSYTDLRRASLSGANLQGADLGGANLSSARGITNEDLERQTYRFKGATMPNGQKYEDWLKSKKAQGKDEKQE
jgi:uncharacterized protein YjbI with pentapeptide repeats